MKTLKTDVVILGAGNAALCAALSARENNAQVIVLERAPFEERGGNSAFTAGAFRFAYDTVEELYEVVDDLSDKEKATTDFGTYSIGDFFDDMGRVTEYRTDPDLAELLIRNSRDTLLWMKRTGIRFQPSYGRQAFKLNDKFRFWGGLSIEAWGGGPGLVEGLHGAAQKAGVQVLYGTRAIDLIREDNLVVGVSGVSGGQPIEVRAKSVILASGGFEANGEWRARYLGPGWDLAKVRGTRFNTGDAIRMALDAGAMSHGHWSGCHSVSWDRNAPEFGDLAVGDGFQKHSYPFGLMINAPG
ncbi:MAG: FAD-dependent oxidoreductase, partial [Rhodospirillales bacterium]|nr:FAD-dependent oxidoreductase [Rhodospirillales bacterium]